MKFHVSVTSGAEEDIRDILNWIAKRSPAGARAWFQRWREVLTALAERADFFGVAPESEDHTVEIRQAIFKTRRGRPYRALFVVEGHRVFVLYVRGPGQQFVERSVLRTPD